MEVGAAQNAIRDPGAPPAGDFMGVKLPFLFVDTFDQEHSRDIEPMKGGHDDNYHCQMVSFIRRFKGVRPLPAASPARTIGLKGDFSQWQRVRPEYRPR